MRALTLPNVTLWALLHKTVPSIQLRWWTKSQAVKVITSENAHKHAQMQYLKPPIRDLQLSQESATHRKHKAFRPFGVTPWNLSYMSFSMLKMIALKFWLDEALGKAISSSLPVISFLRNMHMSGFLSTNGSFMGLVWLFLTWLLKEKFCNWIWTVLYGELL